MMVKIMHVFLDNDDELYFLKTSLKKCSYGYFAKMFWLVKIFKLKMIFYVPKVQTLKPISLRKFLFKQILVSNIHVGFLVNL